MQRMFDEYNDIVDFRLVYINEAHASDGSRPVEYAKELGITEHKDYGQRCSVASKLLSDKSMTIPTLIDEMDNKVNQAYKAHPDRIFLVRKDGKLGVAAARGPFGFEPALRKVKDWLVQYKKNGQEPPLPEPRKKSDEDKGIEP